MRNGSDRRGWRLRARARLWARHRWAAGLLLLFTVVEAVLFPAPTEALLVALVLGRPGQAARLAALATAGSVAGGATGYLVGRTLFDPVVRPLLDWYGLEGRLGALGALYADNLPLALATSGYTPVPYLLYALAGGAFAVPFGPFVAWSAVGRGTKYALICAVASVGAPAIQAAVRRYGGRAVLAAAVAVLLLWWALRG